MLSSKVVERARTTHFALMLVCFSILIASSVRTENKIDEAAHEASDLAKILYLPMSSLASAVKQQLLRDDKATISVEKTLISSIKKELGISNGSDPNSFLDRNYISMMSKQHPQLSIVLLRFRDTSLGQIPEDWHSLTEKAFQFYIPTGLVTLEDDRIVLSTGDKLRVREKFPTIKAVAESPSYKKIQSSYYKYMRTTCGRGNISQANQPIQCDLNIYYSDRKIDALEYDNQRMDYQEYLENVRRSAPNFIGSIRIPIISKAVPFDFLETAKTELGIEREGQSFKQLFPNLFALIETSKNRGIANLNFLMEGNDKTLVENYFADLLALKNTESFELFGLKAPGRLLLLWGSVIITLVLGYLYLHMRELATRHHQTQKAIEEAWIVFYGGWYAKVLVLLSFFILPWVTLGILLTVSYETGRSQFGVTLLSTVISLALQYGIAVCLKILWTQTACDQKDRNV